MQKKNTKQNDYHDILLKRLWLRANLKIKERNGEEKTVRSQANWKIVE